MKKAILVLFTSAFFLCGYAQNVDFDSYKGIESDKVLNLSADQIAKIKKLNNEVGPKFREIGQSNLSGYEKGQKKRQLALEHKAAIREILTEEQIKAWEDSYDKMDSGEGLRDILKDSYEDRLDRLERDYEKNKKSVENSSLSKSEKKSRLEALKKSYKAEKESLKKQKDEALECGVLQE